MSAAAAVASSLSDGLIAHWPMIGAIPQDLTTNRNHGISSNVVLRPDRFGNEYGAYFFNGTNASIRFGTNASRPLPITIAGWVKIGSNGPGSGYIVRNDQDSGSTARAGVWLKINNRQLWIGLGNNDWSRFSREFYCNISLPTNEWVHVAGSLVNHIPEGGDRFRASLFINGNAVPVNDFLDRFSWAIQLGYDGGGGSIGGRFYGTDVLEGFRGTISDLRFYNRQLDVSEIKVLYNVANPNVLDADGDGFSDYSEMVSGTNPQDPASKAQHLKIRQAVQLEFPTASGTTNQVQASPDLVDWWDLGPPIISNGELIRQFFPLDDQHKFFRLKPH